LLLHADCTVRSRKLQNWLAIQSHSDIIPKQSAMNRTIRSSAAFGILLILFLALGRCVSCAADKITIPGTSLRIELPAGWSIGPSPFGFKTDVLWHDASPRYAVQVGDSSTNVSPDPRLSISSCGVLLGVMLSTEAGKAANRIARPASFPGTFDDLVVEIPNKLSLGCLNAGSRVVGVTIYLKEGQPHPELLTTVLQRISDAAFEGQNFVEPPGSVHLRLLNLDVPVPEGKWTAQENTNSWGHNDMISRVMGREELSVTPFVFPYPGSCAALGVSDEHIAAKVVQHPGYLGASWSPTAYVQSPSPGIFVQAMVCRDIPSGKMLMAQIMEGGTAIVESDYAVVSALLENIATAVERKMQTEGPASLRVAAVPMPAANQASSNGRVALSAPPAELVTQVPPVYPPLARQARIQGPVVLKAVIAPDGSVESLELISGHPLLVNAAMDAAKQWHYKPYLINGVPAEVQTTITVNFQLE